MVEFKLSTNLSQIKDKFEKETGFKDLPFELKRRSDGDVLILKIINPTERLLAILQRIQKDLIENDGHIDELAIIEKRPANKSPIQTPEGKRFLQTLSEIQNVNRFSFKNDFMSRYINSVIGAEEQIVSNANHIVMGRRGAGKSMLLLYALEKRNSSNSSSVWIDMQTFNRRSDLQVISDIFLEIIGKLREELPLKDSADIENQLHQLKEVEQDHRRLLPKIRNLLSKYANEGGDLHIFLDDFHVLSKSIQPYVLDMLYSCFRGNQIFLKISAIASLTKQYDTINRIGLEVPQDAQHLSLDRSLVSPDAAATHIQNILDTHAIYSGLKSVKSLCVSSSVIKRLTWVAAGVPRDAISLFSQAITKTVSSSRSRVSISDINMAASETTGIKIRDLNADASDEATTLETLLERIKNFVSENRKNAFLVEIRTEDNLIDNVMSLVDLRMIHIISEGITIGDAGRKHKGFILDYGFYTGVRAAQSVELFNKFADSISYKDLRRLPVFE